MKLSRWTLLWLLIVGVLVAIWIGILAGFITPGNVITFFFVFVIALVVIAFLAIVGAVFLGMVISHRIMSGQAFTPFEEEMLKMRQEVRELRERLEVIAERIGVAPDPKDRMR